MTATENLWGGRFTAGPDETFKLFNDSFSFDKRLFVCDAIATRAQARALVGAQVITAEEFTQVDAAISELLAAHAANEKFLSGDFEDVHSFLESKLVEKIGDLGKKIHTGRSRNDQVATAFRLWLRAEIDDITEILKDFQRSLVESAENQKDAVLPGYTHLQRAMPVMWAHWCLAYFEMLERDTARMADARKRVNILPLGSAALAGTSFNADRVSIAKELGFDDVTRNSLDGVSDRDFAIEFCGAASLAMVHLSRFAEDLILYASSEFQFIELSDAVSTGSSLMPQKKNPDALELIRGKAGRVIGHQVALLTTVKGLPLAYNKDMQEDKEAVFDAVDTLKISLRVAAIVMRNLKVREEKTRAAATKGYLNATELADYLVKKGVPFRTAHDLVGRVVLHAIAKNKELDELQIADFKQFSDAIDADVFDALSLEKTLAAKAQIGGTSPARVREALAAARAKIG